MRQRWMLGWLLRSLTILGYSFSAIVALSLARFAP